MHAGIGEDDSQWRTPTSPRSLRTTSTSHVSGLDSPRQPHRVDGHLSPSAAAFTRAGSTASPPQPTIVLHAAAASSDRQQQQQAELADATAQQPSLSPCAAMDSSDASDEAGEATVKVEDTSHGSQSADLDPVDADSQPANRRPGKVARQAEDAADRAERRIYEDEVLERAHAIEKARAATTKASADTFSALCSSS